MSDFSTAVKYLRLTKVDPATQDQMRSAQTLNGSSHPDKYFTINRARALQRITGTIVLPPSTGLIVGSLLRGRLLFQYNVSVGSSFFIFNAPIINNRQYGALTVKWREGTTVHRYIIYGKKTTRSGRFDSLYFPLYKNQLVQSNCVFEYWYNVEPQIQNGRESGLPHGYTISISALYEPTSADDTGPVIASSDLLNIPSLGSAIPEAVPTQQDDLVYLDN